VFFCRSRARASDSSFVDGGDAAGKVVEPKSQSLKVNGVGRLGDGADPEGAERTFSICPIVSLDSITVTNLEITM
jgi:hypothetical protein